MSGTTAVATFAELHHAPQGFVMPNCWDVGSALLLADAGFPALATTSAGIAFSLGKQDYWVKDPRFTVSQAEMFERIAAIVEAVKVPVSADLEAGYGDSPEAVAETVRLAVQVGLAGANIEDKRPKGELYEEQLAVERVVAAKEALQAARTDFVLTARTDAMLVEGPAGLDSAIRRANLFREAGADCLYAPGGSDLPTVQRLVAEVPGPLNVVVGLSAGVSNVNELLALGVQRISLGGSLARAALGFLRQAAQALYQTGGLGYAAGQIPQAELNGLFQRARRLS